MEIRKYFWGRETEAERVRSGATTLADRIAAGVPPLPEALRYSIEIAEELRMVHSRRRVYGLLQPANIVLLKDRVHLLPGGAVPISPYFSPEQVMGLELDIRSDIFSWGAVLYELLSGHKAFAAPTKPALRFEILDCAPIPLQNVSPRIATLVMRCLEKAPQKRVQRMEILLAELKLQQILAAGIDGNFGS